MRSGKAFLVALLCFIVGIESFAQGHSCPEDLFPMEHPQKRLFGYMNLFGEWKVQPVFTKAFPFRGKTAVVIKGTKYGAVDCKGYLVVRPEYDEISSFLGGIAWVRKGELWGVVREDGKELQAPSFSKVSDVSPFSPYAWVEQEGKWGLFLKDSATFVIQPKYEAFQPINDKLSLVKLDGKLGLLEHQTGTYRVEPEMDHVIRAFSHRLIYHFDGSWGMMTDQGKVLLTPEYDTLYPFLRRGVLLSKEGKQGLYDSYGREILPLAYEEIHPFSEGLSRVKKNGQYQFVTANGVFKDINQYAYAENFHNGRAIVAKDGVFGLVSRYGEWTTEESYLNLKRDYAHPYYVGETNAGWRFLLEDGTALDFGPFEAIVESDPSRFVRVKESGKWGFFDLKEGKLVLEAAYDTLMAYGCGGAIVGKENRFGLWKKDKGLVIPLEFDGMESMLVKSRGCFFRVQESGLFGLYSSQGQEILSPSFAVLSCSPDGVVAAKEKLDDNWAEDGAIYDFKGNRLSKEYGRISLAEGFPLMVGNGKKLGLVNRNGHELLAPKYKKLKAIGEGYFAFKKGKGWGIVDENGLVILEPDYKEIGLSSERWIAVKRENGWDFIDHRGKFKTDYGFEEVQPFSEGVACAKKNGEWGTVDKRGRFKKGGCP